MHSRPRISNASSSEHGPDSVGVLGSARATNEENYLAQKFARVVLGTNNVDCCARVCHAPTAAAMKAMLGTGAATNSFDDIEQARTILLCGTNATENHPIVGARIKQAVLRGAKLIVIDPREIELARLRRHPSCAEPGHERAAAQCHGLRDRRGRSCSMNSCVQRARFRLGRISTIHSRICARENGERLRCRRRN